MTTARGYDKNGLKLSSAGWPVRTAPRNTVEGALGPLFYATVVVARTPVDALVDPGSSATIMSFELFGWASRQESHGRHYKRRVMLQDHSRRPIPVFAEVNLEFSHQGQRVTVPVYLRSDQGPAGESCLLGTNVVLPLGLMVPGVGVQARELGVAEVGVVRLIRAERVPSQCGAVVEALVKDYEGPVMVKHLQSVLGSCGLEMEHMLVEPDRSGKVSIVVTSPSPSMVCLDTGQCLGSAHVFEEWV